MTVARSIMMTTPHFQVGMGVFTGALSLMLYRTLTGIRRSGRSGDKTFLSPHLRHLPIPLANPHREAAVDRVGLARDVVVRHQLADHRRHLLGRPLAVQGDAVLE